MAPSDLSSSLLRPPSPIPIKSASPQAKTPKDAQIASLQSQIEELVGRRKHLERQLAATIKDIENARVEAEDERRRSTEQSKGIKQQWKKERAEWVDICELVRLVGDSRASNLIGCVLGLNIFGRSKLCTMSRTSRRASNWTTSAWQGSRSRRAPERCASRF